MATYYDDNYGTYEIESEEDIEFYQTGTRDGFLTPGWVEEHALTSIPTRYQKYGK